MQTLFLQFDRPGFEWRRFEALILDFLSTGLSFEVLEPSSIDSSGPNGKTSKSHKIIRAQQFGGEGDNQQGIDLVATTDTGEEWVFQCKHSSTIGLTETRDAIQLAKSKHPQANRYFLFVSGVVKPKAFEFVASEAKWEVWDGRTISAHFFAKILPRQAFTIVGRHFGETEARRLFPLTDHLLVSPDEFFLPWTRENQLFHHKAPLVGRGEELEAFKGFINDPTLRVCILVARGGIGKTRLLKGLAEQALIDFPDREILFVNQAAARDAAPQSLRWNQDGQVVVIQDDAHRVGSLESPFVGKSCPEKGF